VTFPLLACVLAILLAVPTAGAVMAEIDLASDTAWTLSIDGGEPRPIRVPAGGWNSDRQSPRINEDTDVKDHVVYRRAITIPPEAAGQVVALSFGAVNYGAEVFLDDQKVGDHDAGPFTAFEVDLTDRVEPGRTYTLSVKAFTLHHYNRNNREAVERGEMTVAQALEKNADIRVPTGFVYFNRMSSLGYGINRWVTLRIYPRVRISDVFVRPSVTKQTLGYDVWITNRSERERRVTLRSSLASWNRDAWDYPSIGDHVAVIPAGQTAKVSVDGVPWTLGSQSYWWPNVPFREDYVAKLHWLDLRVDEGDVALDSRRQRFGFVEHAEGPYYYTINGVRLNLPGDATAITQGGVYDGYAEAPAFRPPTGPGTGAAETWRRYMRLGIRANRTHQEPPTPHMLESADEVGFILIPESGLRGSYLRVSHDPDEPSYAPHLQAMVRAARNHPSVARYSLTNEMHAIARLIDFVAPLDPTRPIVFESNGHPDPTKVQSELGHAWTVSHYSAWPRPARQIYGMGEFAWSTDGLADFATQGKDLRLNDVSYFAGWSWLNYWPNFLEGYGRATHAWKQNNHPDRRDGIDGWGSPIVNYVQQSLHPFLVIDHALEQVAIGGPDWPGVTPRVPPGRRIERKIEVFNDALFGNRLTLRWSARLDRPDGPMIAEGSRDLEIEPGFHVTETIAFETPNLAAGQERTIALVLESLRDGQVVFREDRIRLLATEKATETMVQLIGEDATTQGTWMGRYGRDGYEVAGADTKLPSYLTLEWVDDGPWVWEKTTEDVRGLQHFVNDGNRGYARLAAKRGRYGTVRLSVDVGEREHEMSLYFVDWHGRNQPQRIIVPEADLQHTLTDWHRQGKYVRFRIRGKATFILDGGGTTEVSGVFFDPVTPATQPTTQPTH
jgi:hypothetical protein